MNAPVLHKDTSRLDLVELLSVGVDKMQRNFEPLQQQINAWQMCELTPEQAKLIIYRSVVEERFPMKLLTSVHQHYFTPQYEEFKAGTMWSLSNAFTSALKTLKPVRQFQLTAKLGSFLSNASLPKENLIEEGRHNGSPLRPLQAVAHQ